MKKVFLLLTLIATTISAWGATTVTKTVAQLKTTYGWENDKCYYKPFALDDVITISSVDGTSKFLDGTNLKEMRYYQGNDKGYGSIIIKAKAGYVITSVKLKYSQTSGRSVPCVFWANNNQRVPVSDTLGNNVARSFYSNEVVLHVGRVTNATGGQIRVTEYSVTYEQATLDRMFTKSFVDLVMQHNWASGTCPIGALPNQTLQLNDALSLKTDDTGNMKYWVDNRALTCYKRSGNLTFMAREGATIKRIRIIYNQIAETNSLGVLILSSDWGTDGNNIPAAKQIASNTWITVNGNSISFRAGNTKNNGTSQSQITITGFQIEYTDGSSQMETFSKLTNVSGSSEVKFVGDNGYKWKVKNFAHRDTCAIYDYLGTRLSYNGYIATDEAIEGGIKNASFDWCMAEPLNGVSFSVKAGSITDNVTAAPTTKMPGHHMTYNHAFNEKSNATFSINMGAKASTAQAQPIFGPVTITPYLLYTNKSVTIKAKDYASNNFKYTNTALINNTAGEGTISYAVSGENADKIASINSSTGEVTIIGAGTVTVTASWEGVTTTYSLTIQLETPSISFAESEVTKMVSAGSYKQTLTFTTPSSGTGIYSIVSGPASGTIDDDGTVHFTEAGDYVIKGKFNTLPYKADSATYTLKITDLNVPELSFAASSIEKPVGAADFTNELTTTAGIGDTIYTSSAEAVAEVNASGLVHIVGTGTTTIKAATAQTLTYAAGEATYSLKVFPLSKISFAGDTSVYLNAPAFTRAVKVNAGDGEITYSSSAEGIATVDANGKVTLTGTAYGPVTITAIIAKTGNYWGDTATYTLNVNQLKMPTASFAEPVVNKVQGFAAFKKEASTESDGVKHYFSSDTRVATVNETTGEVTKGEKPGTTIISVSLDASATWEALDNAAQYTLNVSGAPVEGWNFITKTVAQMRGTAEWTGGSQHPNIDIVEGIVLSDGKYYSNIDGEHFRYYYNADPKYVSSTTFTIQAKAGVIIQTVKINYIQGNNKMVLADDNYNGEEVPSTNRIISGTTYKVDANSVTYYVGRTGTLPSANNFVNVTGYEIKYFDPSTGGVAVTKTVMDLGKDLGLIHNLDTGYHDIKINHAITLHADKKGTLKYWTNGTEAGTNLGCYRWTGPIDIKAREGATIHYVKITYNGGRAVLTKYYGTDGKNIPAVDRIASDSVLYVNANSLRLYVGDTLQNDGSTSPTLGIKKIYVNYTDSSVVTVDNFDNCESKGTGSTVDVAGVDGKYAWKFTNFGRDNAERMYYDQSVKINKNGKISTQYTGGLKEVAFDWHPTTNAAVNFTVKAGDSTFIIDKAAQGGVYTFNFKKVNNKTNGEFSITVNSDAAVEVGHVSLTPYLIYTCKDTTIAAKANMNGYTNNTLINYTGQPVTYSVSGENANKIASVDSDGKVTILGGGTVTVNATADGATASYQLTINLESTSASFAQEQVERLVTAKTFAQKLNITTGATEGNVITYAFEGAHDGATLSDSTVTFTKAGTFIIKGRLEQNLPYAAAEATYTLMVSGKPVPHIQFTDTVKSQKLSDGTFSVSLKPMPAGVGTLSYNSTNKVVATVDQNGVVTPLKAGVTYIKAYVAEGDSYAADSASCRVTIMGDPIPGAATVKGNIAEIASQGEWNDGSSHPYFRLDEVISVDDTAKANAYYTDESKSLRYLQNTKKGLFTIRAKAGAIIQSVKLTYTSVNDGVVTTNYGEDGKIIAAANQYVSGVTYKVDANRLVFYTGSTSDNANGEVYIKDIEVSYFKSPVGVAVTKNVIDLAKQYNLQGDTSYMSLSLDNVVTMSVSKTGTMKYLDGINVKELRFYQGLGAFTIAAREGAKINYVKVTYSGVNNGVFTTDACRSSVPVEEQVASDSVLYVNAQSISLYPSSSGTNTNGQPRVRKIYVNYTDSAAIVDNFDNCTAIYGGADAKEVMGADSTFKWQFTQFNRDSLRRIGYDQAMMLRQNGGKIAANNTDGGIKEVSFDWFASNSEKSVKFYVKAGETTDTVQLAATGGWYPRTYTKTGIKTNGAFSIEIDPESGSQMEIGHISLTPYLFYKEKQVNVMVKGTYKNTSLVDYRDSKDPITYSSSKDSVASVDANGLVTANHVGKATISATGNGVTTSYEITVEGDKTTIVLKRNDGTNDADTIVNNYGATMPTITLPTRDGYRFNAYFPDATASKESERITVTSWDAKTYWVADCVQKGVKMIDKDRKWVYEEATHTLYAQWMPEVTITLDNQGAKTPGTASVITANCPNNASVNLSQGIATPDKDSVSFMGYFTEPAGKGAQLIDRNGAFIANVAGYTNGSKMWLKTEGATLYAHWMREQKEVTDTTAASNLPKWADVTIKEGGDLVMDVNLTVHDVVIKASASATGTSGQITGDNIASHLNITGNAYFDLTINQCAEGKTVAEQWHAFTVPFPVDAINGIFNAADSSKLTNEKDYAIMDYHGDVRATGAYGWKKFRGILQPGTFYIMTINGDVATFRMKMHGEFSVASANLPVYQYAKSGQGADTDAGWNGVGNSQLNYRYVNATVQVLDPSTYTYVPKTASDAAHFSVGTPFFYQASADGNIELATTVPSAVAARRLNKDLKEMAVTLSNGKYTDRLLISSTAEATYEYQIGRDLTKMTMTSAPAVPQIFALDYNTKLCMVDAPMAGNEARYYLSLYAPKTGEYTLSAAPVAGYEVFLTLNGDVIWNLSKDNYIIDLEKGTNEDYGLILTVAQTTTDIENNRSTDSPADRFTKFIYDENLIIIRDGKQFNAQGALIK